MNRPIDPQAQLPDEVWPESFLLDSGITRALATPPRIAIPSDFAARVAALATEHEAFPHTRMHSRPIQQARLTVQHHGRNAAIVGLGVLLGLIALCAHRSVGASLLWTSMEAVFCLQFSVLAVWLVARDLGRYFSAWTSQR